MIEVCAQKPLHVENRGDTEDERKNSHQKKDAATLNEKGKLIELILDLKGSLPLLQQYSEQDAVNLYTFKIYCILNNRSDNILEMHDMVLMSFRIPNE